VTDVALQRSVQAALDELVAGGFSADFTSITFVDAIVAETHPPPHPEPRSAS
jgi:hypothetical protein